VNREIIREILEKMRCEKEIIGKNFGKRENK
jgi:hypothetical protein